MPQPERLAPPLKPIPECDEKNINKENEVEKITFVSFKTFIGRENEMLIYTAEGCYCATFDFLKRDSVILNTRELADAERICQWLASQAFHTARIYKSERCDQFYSVDVPRIFFAHYLSMAALRTSTTPLVTCKLFYSSDMPVEDLRPFYDQYSLFEPAIL